MFEKTRPTDRVLSLAAVPVVAVVVKLYSSVNPSTYRIHSQNHIPSIFQETT